MRITSIKFALFLLVVISSCSQKSSETKTNYTQTKAIPVTGYYVTDEYFQRGERYDWVGVNVNQVGDSLIDVAIRSRADIKRPTCTFDDTAVLVKSNTFEVNIDSSIIHFIFSDSSMQITSDDDGILAYFCSGGGSLRNTYQRLSEKIDPTQLEYIDFDKELSLQGISFHVKSVNSGFVTKLIIQPENLEIDNQQVEHVIKGWVRDAEIEDLNSDGFPELLVYVQSSVNGTHSYPIAYSVNNGKSMSQVYFPDPNENPDISDGYHGYDEFTLVETKLGHRFPVFSQAENGWENTGKIRQITYIMKDGEASRYFAVDQIYEY